MSQDKDNNSESLDIISDFTVISGWETFTADLERVLKEWKSLDAENVKTVINYKNTVRITVELVVKVDKISILEGIPRFCVVDEPSGGPNYIARRFCLAGERYLLIRTEEEDNAYLTLSTARLLTSSAIIGLGQAHVGRKRSSKGKKDSQSSQNEPESKCPIIFIEYGDGDVMGVDTILQRRYSITNFRVYKRSAEQLFRETFMKHFDGVSRSEIATLYATIFSCHLSSTILDVDDDNDNIYGFDESVLESVELNTIYPQLETGLIIAGLLPDPLAAPIWMLSVNKKLPTGLGHSSGRLARLIDGIAHLIYEADQSLTDASQEIHSKTKLFNLLPTKDDMMDDCQFDEYFKDKQLQKQPSLALALIKVILREMSRDFTDYKSQRFNFIKSIGAISTFFIKYLRGRWRKREPLMMMGQQDDKLNHHSSLLEQKLFMVNYCIQKENELKAISLEEEGKKCKHSKLFLFKDPNIPLWIPFTQDPGPVTGDVLQHHQIPSSSLPEAKRHAHLLSDMEAFKAANPRAQFIDFVRWHSPRDFDEKSSTLSERMKMAKDGNIWLELWDSSKPIPITRQKLIFDHVAEVEKAIFWFESALLSEFLESLLALSLEYAYQEFKQDETIKPPTSITDTSLTSFLERLSLLEYTWSLTRQLELILPPSDVAIPNDQLILGNPILIAPDDVRSRLMTSFFSSLSPSSSPSSPSSSSSPSFQIIQQEIAFDTDKKSLYIRLIDGDIAEIAQQIN